MIGVRCAVTEHNSLTIMVKATALMLKLIRRELTTNLTSRSGKKIVKRNLKTLH